MTDEPMNGGGRAARARTRAEERAEAVKTPTRIELAERIEALEREGAPPGTLLAELVELVREASAWAEAEDDPRARAAAAALAEAHLGSRPQAGSARRPIRGHAGGGTLPVESRGGRTMRVADVMTTGVVTVPPETPLKEVAALLHRCGISGAPVVDDAGRVLGVVSEADILAQERGPRPRPRLARVRGRDDAERKSGARTAGEAMTSPAIAIAPWRRVDAAAATMLDRGVNRLPVLDSHGRLVGIVTRADLVRAFVHTDEQIADEIRREVLTRDLWLDPEEFDLAVEQGDVTISGDLRSTDVQEALTRCIRLVPGVVSVAVRERAAAPPAG